MSSKPNRNPMNSHEILSGIPHETASENFLGLRALFNCINVYSHAKIHGYTTLKWDIAMDKPWQAVVKEKRPRPPPSP